MTESWEDWYTPEDALAEERLQDRLKESLRRTPRYARLVANMVRDDRVPVKARAALVAGGAERRAIEIYLATGQSPQPPTLASGASGLAQAIALALLGGLILNLMPCVLPVLALKAVAVAELARRRRREALSGPERSG